MSYDVRHWYPFPLNTNNGKIAKPNINEKRIVFKCKLWNSKQSKHLQNSRTQRFNIIPGNNWIFFNCYLAAPRPPLDHYHRCSLTRPMLITCVFRIRPEGHQGPCSVVGSLSQSKCLVGFELRTFRFWSQRLNPLGHSGKWIRWIMWIVISPKIYPQEWNLHKLLLKFW